ncbi:Uncharacterised protein [Mycobacteroides abscessus subsp. abscessus]|nr:Uncharacterised protein [Mycobacteroides abscessus subsp. abscessus]
MRVTGRPSSTVASTIAFGSGMPEATARSNHLCNRGSQPSASQSTSRSPLPSFSPGR